MTIATILITSLSLLPVARGGELARLEMQPVEIALAGGGTATAHRGTLRVPIVRADAASKPIGVDVWRFPARAEEPSRPPIFRLNGGPGWPGLEPRDIDWEQEVAPWIETGDLVIVGQRGIGTSEPNTDCSAFVEWIDPDLPAEERAAAVHAQCGACRDHWESQGYDLTGFNVLEAAADVDDVRRLLGYDKIILMGGSFGSHWAMTVMRFHPDAVERALLHGMEGPDHTYDSPAGILNALERIAAQAEASPELAGKLPEHGLVESLLLVIEDLERDPFEVEVGGQLVPITADAVRARARGYTSRVNSRRSVGGWPADVMRLAEGQFELLARALAAARRNPSGLPTASFFNLDCGSGITRERHARYKSDPAVQIVGDLGWFYDSACPAWSSDLGDDFRADFRTSIPTVVVHGTWDVSTPFENALELLPCFEKLKFVRIESGTHGALGEAVRHDAAFAAAVTRFLESGATEDLPGSVELPPIQWEASW